MKEIFSVLGSLLTIGVIVGQAVLIRRQQKLIWEQRTELTRWSLWFSLTEIGKRLKAGKYLNSPKKTDEAENF